MVDWIGKFSLRLKRLKDSWMDLLPLSAMRQQRRESQYHPDMTQLNAERRDRNEEAVDPDEQTTRGNWNATHGTTHGSLFPFDDNLTTVMFIVASDLNDAQRESHKFTFSPRNECHCLHPRRSANSLCGFFLFSEKLHAESFSLRERTPRQYKQNLHRRRLS